MEQKRQNSARIRGILNALDAPVRNVHAGRRGRSGEGTGRACRRRSLVNVAIAMHRLGIATRSPIDFIG